MSEPKFIPRPGQIDFTNIRECPVINCIVEYNGKILLVERSKVLRFYPEYWNGISGFLDEPHKPLLEKIHEELREELGFTEEDIVAIHEGPIIRMEDTINDKVWITHPIHVQVKRDTVKLDWEAQNHAWILPEELSHFKIMPRFDEVVEAVMPFIGKTI